MARQVHARVALGSTFRPDPSDALVDHDGTRLQFSECVDDPPMATYPDEPKMARAKRLAPRPTLARPSYVEMANPRLMYEEDFAVGAPDPEIIPPRRQPFKFSLRTIGTFTVVVCAAAIIAGAGMLLFSRNDKSSLAWFAQPRQSAKMEVAIEPSGSKAGPMPDS